MGFKPMSIERLQWLQRRQRGFTLVETLVSVAVGSLVMAVIATLGYYGSLCMAVSLNYTAIDAASESAVNQLTRDARRANKVTSYTTNSLVLEDFDTFLDRGALATGAVCAVIQDAIDLYNKAKNLPREEQENQQKYEKGTKDWNDTHEDHLKKHPNNKEIS